uniref:Uncharacterized protein n=1 Tax=Ascaris lumbricoides TaxID=6252 RepID=A0A9J2PIZ7_ASCLU
MEFDASATCALRNVETNLPKPAESSKEVTISEQMDPTMYTRQGIFPNGFFGHANGYNFNLLKGPFAVTFEFRCKCNSKVNKNANSVQNVQVPADANAQAQQQIQQLQEQLRQQTEQLRRQQQLTSTLTGFEQFANLLSIADGLDCACTGVSPNMNLNQQGLSTGPSFINTQGFIHPQIAGMVGGVPLTAPFNTRLLPLDRLSAGPMLP